MADYYNITYNGKKEITIEEYLNQNKERITGLSVNDLLLYEDEFGEKNLDKIYGEYFSMPVMKSIIKKII